MNNVIIYCIVFQYTHHIILIEILLTYTCCELSFKYINVQLNRITCLQMYITRWTDNLMFCIGDYIEKTDDKTRKFFIFVDGDGLITVGNSILILYDKLIGVSHWLNSSVCGQFTI